MQKIKANAKRDKRITKTFGKNDCFSRKPYLKFQTPVFAIFRCKSNCSDVSI